MRNKYYTSRDPIKNYFPLPNEVFALGLSPGALAVYSYLMYIEDRTTYQCHASYQKMRGLSMEEVKRTNGRIDFEDALLSERGV